jgi:hypothetical protein
MGVNFAMTGINHKPFIIRFIIQGFQQGFPQAFIAPTTKAPVGVLPATVVRWQISPGSACTHYPKDSVDKLSIVTGISTPRAFTSRQMWFKQCPNPVRYIVAAMRWLHKFYLLFFQEDTRISIIIQYY